MTGRDTTPYTEHTDTVNGTDLHSIHCLTTEQLELVRNALKLNRQELNRTSRWTKVLGADTLKLVHDHAHALDTLILHLFPKS